MLVICCSQKGQVLMRNGKRLVMCAAALCFCLLWLLNRYEAHMKYHWRYELPGEETARACDSETCTQIGNLQGQLGNLTFHVFWRPKTQTQRATQLDVTQWVLSCRSSLPPSDNPVGFGRRAGWACLRLKVTVERLMVRESHAGQLCVCDRVKETGNRVSFVAA